MRELIENFEIFLTTAATKRNQGTLCVCPTRCKGLGGLLISLGEISWRNVLLVKP